MNRETMTQGQQDAGQERPTITDDMIERAARGIAAHWHDWHTNEALGRQRALAIAALEAALNPQEGTS